MRCEGHLSEIQLMLDNDPAGAIAAGRPQAQAFAFASEWKDLVNELTHNPSTHGDAPDNAFAKEAIRRLAQRFRRQDDNDRV